MSSPTCPCPEREAGRISRSPAARKWLGRDPHPQKGRPFSAGPGTPPLPVPHRQPHQTCVRLPNVKDALPIPLQRNPFGSPAPPSPSLFFSLHVLLQRLRPHS